MCVASRWTMQTGSVCMWSQRAKLMQIQWVGEILCGWAQAQYDSFHVLDGTVECVPQIHEECVALPMQPVLDVEVQESHLV